MSGRSLELQVGFPLRRPGKPPGRKSPKNGEKLQNSPPLSDPRNEGKITEKLHTLYFRSNFTPFLVQFSPFSGHRKKEGAPKMVSLLHSGNLWVAHAEIVSKLSDSFPTSSGWPWFGDGYGSCMGRFKRFRF